MGAEASWSVEDTRRQEALQKALSNARTLDADRDSRIVSGFAPSGLGIRGPRAQDSKRLDHKRSVLNLAILRKSEIFSGGRSATFGAPPRTPALDADTLSVSSLQQSQDASGDGNPFSPPSEISRKKRGTQLYPNAHPPQLELEQAFAIGERLGETKWFELFRASQLSGGDSDEVCVQLVKPSFFKQYVKVSRRERRAWGRVKSHPNLVQFKGWGGPDTKRRLWRVTEHCKGSLADMRRWGRLKEKHIAHALGCALRALAHLHSHSVVHGNVCASNLFMADNFQVKLGDLGLGDRYSDNNIAFRNVEWMPPERIRAIGDEYSQVTASTSTKTPDDIIFGSKADVWGLGITALELANGKPPLFEKSFSHIRKKRLQGPPPQLARHGAQGTWSELFCDFVRSCLVKNSAVRPTAVQLLSHEFMRLGDWRDMAGRSSGVIMENSQNVSIFAKTEDKSVGDMRPAMSAAGNNVSGNESSIRHTDTPASAVRSPMGDTSSVRDTVQASMHGIKTMGLSPRFSRRVSIQAEELANNPEGFAGDE